MFLRKLRFAASYRYIFIMLLRKIIEYQEMTLPYKIDPVQDFPGNNPFLYFYLLKTLVFRLNPCPIPDQENSF